MLPLPRFEHRRQRRARGADGCHQVHVQRGQPLLVRDACKAAEPQGDDPDVVDQDVEPAELVGSRDECSSAVGCRQVDRDRMNQPPLGESRQISAGAASTGDDADTFVGERFRDGEADALAGTRHDSDLAPQVEIHQCPVTLATFRRPCSTPLPPLRLRGPARLRSRGGRPIARSSLRAQCPFLLRGESPCRQSCAIDRASSGRPARAPCLEKTCDSVLVVRRRNLPCDHELHRLLHVPPPKSGAYRPRRVAVTNRLRCQIAPPAAEPTIAAAGEANFSRHPPDGASGEIDVRLDRRSEMRA